MRLMLKGSSHSDTIVGGRGRDLIDGGRGNDRLVGGGQNDRLIGGSGRDVLDGGRGNDWLDGGRQADKLIGGPGRDVLDGGRGNDRLTGGDGADRMIGGSGHDTFLFSSTSLAGGRGGRDAITDFTIGQDTIDLSGLDADVAKAGVDAFTVFLTRDAQFTGAGQLRYDSNTGLLSGNIDGDGDAEFEVVLANKPAQLILGRDIAPAGHAPVGPADPPIVGPSISAYDKAVLADLPTLFLPLSKAGQAMSEADVAQVGRQGSYHGNMTATPMPNGEHSAVFDGRNSYFEFPDAPDLSVPKTGILTIEAWLRPDALIFPVQEGSGYIHWMGKGEPGHGSEPDQMEWAARMYGSNNTDVPSRENRISGYGFNMEGGRGIGSYFQDPISAGTWIHYVFVINTTPGDAQDPGYVRIYRDGRNSGALTDPWDDMDSLLEYWPDPTTPHLVQPGDGNAPLRVGTRDFSSFFLGAIGKVAVYDHELTPAQIQRHYDAMWHS